MQTGWIHDAVRKRLKLKQWVWQGIAPREARRCRGGGFDRRVPLKNDFVWAQARALKLELLRIRRHRLVLVCFARLALAPYPIVFADAPPPGNENASLGQIQSSSTSGGMSETNHPCRTGMSCTYSLSERAGRCSPLRTPCKCFLSERAGRCSPLRTPCTCSLSERAGRCSPLRTPYTGSFAERADRCSPLRTPCTCSFSERAGRCSPLRTPCIGSFSERAGRCSTLRTPCTLFFDDCARRFLTLHTPGTGSFSDCAHIARACPLVLASLPHCPPPHLCLAPPAYCCPLYSAPSNHPWSRPMSGFRIEPRAGSGRY